MAVTVLIVGALFIAYRIYIIIYNLYFHPLAKVPGPKLYAISWFPKLWAQQIRGHHYSDLKHLHEIYGDTVRTGPDEVSNVSSQAWDDICGSKEFPRDVNFLLPTQIDPRNSFLSPVKHEHSRMRRLMAPAFTDKSLLRHEDILMQWTDVLTENLRKENSESFDIGRKLTWATFDIMGVLSFGKSFGCLEKNEHHVYLKAVDVGAVFLSVLQIFLQFELTKSLFKLALRLPIPWAKALNRMTSTAKLTRQDWETTLDEDRDDVMTAIWRSMQKDKQPITTRQADDIASMLCMAGAESTGVLLGGMVWWLLNTPHAYLKLSQEIRSTFKEKSEMTMTKIAKMPYLQACIMESLRVHSPFAIALPRVVPAGGATVDGYFLPAGTICGVSHYAQSRANFNFTDADKFIPERFLDDMDPRYANDRYKSFRPFGKGSLDCIGKPLALAQVRMIITKLFWNFDLELQPESLKWVSTEKAIVRMMRQKAPIMVTAKPVVRV